MKTRGGTIMIAQIQFLKMDRSESVESFVTEQLEYLQTHIPHQKEAHFHVWLECENSQVQPGQDLFRCAIEVDGLRRKQFFAEKEDSNFYKAFHNCVDALDKVFRREKRVARKNKREKLRFDRLVNTMAIG
jgi:ribosome-associated translation inhibitor RaiA